ncbi:coiled-coil domain-containing protein 69 isoform X9 [Antennarius striatus]|uniref:coiled-coil domain-containing protein 69 isoform X9 n=1 Tax=Antennarius striatus TaxID=241820 RepID=UPI0035B0FA09
MAAEDAEGRAVGQWGSGEGGAPEAPPRRGGVFSGPEHPGQGEGGDDGRPERRSRAEEQSRHRGTPEASGRAAAETPAGEAPAGGGASGGGGGAKEVEALGAELQAYRELQRRVEESSFKKNLQRNIQAHGSPGAFWESEQESLLFVIEMKSERVQEQNRKLQQMNVLTERNLTLEDQTVLVLQQNEDLRVRIDGCQALIRYVSLTPSAPPPHALSSSSSRRQLLLPTPPVRRPLATPTKMLQTDSSVCPELPQLPSRWRLSPH